MKFIYPAIFTELEDGTYVGRFPDLEGCTAKGRTLDDAIEDANEAAIAWIDVDIEENTPLPPVSDINDLELKENEVARNICVNYRFYDGWEE